MRLRGELVRASNGLRKGIGGSIWRSLVSLIEKLIADYCRDHGLPRGRAEAW